MTVYCVEAWYGEEEARVFLWYSRTEHEARTAARIAIEEGACMVAVETWEAEEFPQKRGWHEPCYEVNSP